MRIVYTSVLNPWDPRHGGGQRAVHELACAMAGLGHEIDVVYSGIGSVPTTDLPYRAYVLPHREHLYFNPLEFWRFLSRRKLEGEILHANGYEGAFLRHAVRGRVALVITSHHPDPATLLDAPEHVHWIRRARWTRQNVIPLVDRRALRSAHLVTVPSVFLASALRERGYLDKDAWIEVVPYGVSPFPPAKNSDSDVELVCVARLDHQKGIDVLLQALALMNDPKPRLDVVGTGLQEGELRCMVDRLGLESRVRFRGYQARSVVGAILADAAALVLPSRSESFGLVLLEAMLADLPIVATRVGGIPEVVRDESEALLVPPENPAALAAALTRILRDHELRYRLPKAARARVAAFTWERAAKRYEKLYESLRGQSGATQRPPGKELCRPGRGRAEKRR
jgi:glycosyltransferase involved in cell wall biosynthesis